MGKRRSENVVGDGFRFERYLEELGRQGRLGAEKLETTRYDLHGWGDGESESAHVELGEGASGEPLFAFEVYAHGDRAARLLSFLRELDQADDEEEVH